MKNYLSILIAILLLAGSSCQQKETKDSYDEVAKELEKDIEAIKQVLKKYEQATAEGDATAYANLFTEDAIWALPNAPVAKSKAEIQLRVQPIMEMLWAELEEPASEMKVVGEFAYVLSDVTGKFIQKSDSLVIPISNTALRILRKENGEWKISHQINNSKLPQ